MYKDWARAKDVNEDRRIHDRAMLQTRSPIALHPA